MTAVVDVSFEERYWYPEDGGVVWLSGFQLIDAASGSFIGRDDPQLAARGLRVAGVAGAARFHAEELSSGELEPGSVLELRRDPENEHDQNAIAVHARDGGQVGWVPRELAEEIAPELDAARPWSAVVLREQRASPRDPRTGLTMLLAADGEIELRELSPGAGRGAGRPRSGAGRTSPRRPGPPR